MVMENLRIAMPGIASADTAARSKRLPDAVSLLTVDRYVSSSGSLDSLLSVGPIQILTVNDIAKRDFSLKLYLTKRQEIKGSSMVPSGLSLIRVKCVGCWFPKIFLPDTNLVFGVFSHI